MLEPSPLGRQPPETLAFSGSGAGPGSADAGLRALFHPRSVAIVGASRDPGGIGWKLMESLLRNRFPGKIYPVNPKACELFDLPVYPSISRIPYPIDLALIVVPRDAVLPVAEECIEKKVPALVVISAGFAESGPEGRELQNRLVARLREHGIRLVGPNCLGLISNQGGVSFNAIFARAAPPAGHLAMSSESGALGLCVLSAAERLELGLSSFVSVGNRADVSSNDLLEYWENDPATRVILLYLESFGNPRRFARIARRVGRTKPIVAMKAGRTRAGQRAAGSHTAALAASESGANALFHQTGLIRAETLEELFDLAAALNDQPLPRGPRVGLVCNAGGPGILCADACEAGGLVLPEPSAVTRERLAEFLPRAASIGNPVDMIASAGAEHFRRTVFTLLSAGEFDALIVLYFSVGLANAAAVAQGIGHGVAEARRACGTSAPVLVCWMPQPERPYLDVSDTERIPCYSFPEEPARVLARLAQYVHWRDQPLGAIPPLRDVAPAEAHRICTTALEQRGPGWLTAGETRDLLKAFGIPLAPGAIASDADEAVGIAREAGYPVAAKVASHHIVHKTEAGLIRLNLATDQAVRDAFTAFRLAMENKGELAAFEGVLIQPMIEDGAEVMIGMTHDPLFGPLLAFGLGGIHVEILKDVCFRVTPLTDRDAQEMIESIRGHELLKGYRGHAPADIPALQDVLLRVSRLVEELPAIQEMDLNPIFALPPGQGCRIVDARIRVGQPPAATTA